MPTPILGLTEWAAAQASPWFVENLAKRVFEFFASGGTIEDRNLLTPAALTPAEGDAYLIDGTGAGDWTGHDGQIALLVNGGWFYLTPTEGMRLWVADEAKLIQYVASAWVDFASGGGTSAPAVSREQTGTSYTAVLADANKYLWFSDGAAIAFTIPPHADVAFPVDTVITVEQSGAGQVTLTPGAGVTLRSRGGALKTAGQFAVVQLKKLAANTWTVLGDATT